MTQPIDMMIVGSQKCGTSSLKKYLGTHPSISVHHTAEFSFFLSDDEYESGFESAWERHFSASPRPYIVAKSVGLCLSEKGLERLRLHNPNMRIVLLVREPIARAYSSYLMDKSLGSNELGSFDEVIREAVVSPVSERLYRSFLAYGDYEEVVKRLTRHFPIGQLSVQSLETLNTQPKDVCNELCLAARLQPLQLDDFPVHNAGRQPKSLRMARILAAVRKNNGLAKRLLRKVIPRQLASSLNAVLRDFNREASPPPPIPPLARRMLAEFYADRNDRFAQRFGIRWPHDAR